MSSTDRELLRELTFRILDLTDLKDWPGVRACLADEVDVDFTSLAGGAPARMAADDLVAAWAAGVHRDKRSFHLAGSDRVTTTGDTAVVEVKGYAWNELSAAHGGATWEVWGAYELRFVRAGESWRCSGFRFDAWRQAGDPAVRTHTL